MRNAHDSSGPSVETANPVTPEAVLEALQKVQLSEMFSGASRLGDLLEYIVKQYLADPSRKILAKTIAEEVYGRAPDIDGDNQNIVRVDAGRLRRRLAEYYAGPGQSDPISIHIDPGGYVPRFEFMEPEKPAGIPPVRPLQLAGSSRTGVLSLFAATLIALAIGVGLGSVLFRSNPPSPPFTVLQESSGDPKLEAERRAHLAKSPASLQAVTLSDHARFLIFPMWERPQLELSLAMFQQAISKDNMYFGGYAGASQSLAALAIFLPDGPERSALMAKARRMVDRAEELSPANSWTQSALSWVLFAEGRIQRAKEHADIALNLAPKDGNVLDFYAIIALSIGDFESALEASRPDRPRTSGRGRFTFRNFYGAASYHLGMYKEAITSLSEASISGDPISAPTLAYLAAANHRLGETEKAKRLVLELKDNWPSFDPQLVLGRLYVNSRQVQEITDTLRDIGWTTVH